MSCNVLQVLLHAFQCHLVRIGHRGVRYLSLFFSFSGILLYVAVWTIFLGFHVSNFITQNRCSDIHIYKSPSVSSCSRLAVIYTTEKFRLILLSSQTATYVGKFLLGKCASVCSKGSCFLIFNQSLVFNVICRC